MYPTTDISKILHLEHCVKKVSDKKIEELFETFVSLRMSDKICDKIEVNSIILMLLSRYIKLAGLKTLTLTKPSAYTEELYSVLKYIDENIEKHLSNTDLAEFLHMHTNHFIKYFNEFQRIWQILIHYSSPENSYFSISNMEVTKIPSSSFVYIDLSLLHCLSLPLPKNPLSSTALDSPFSI